MLDIRGLGRTWRGLPAPTPFFSGIFGQFGAHFGRVLARLQPPLSPKRRLVRSHSAGQQAHTHAGEGCRLADNHNNHVLLSQFPVLVRVLALGTSLVIQPNEPLWSSMWGEKRGDERKRGDKGMRRASERGRERGWWWTVDPISTESAFQSPFVPPGPPALDKHTHTRYPKILLLAYWVQRYVRLGRHVRTTPFLALCISNTSTLGSQKQQNTKMACLGIHLA